MRLPAVGGPSMGMSVTVTCLPVSRLRSTPCRSVSTSGVFNQKPCSPGAPREAIVVPSRWPDAAPAAAADRSDAVDASNCSGVRAPATGIGVSASGTVSASCGEIRVSMSAHSGNSTPAHADNAINIKAAATARFFPPAIGCLVILLSFLIELANAAALSTCRSVL